MKSLTDGTLVLLALYAQACSAEANNHALPLNSQSQLTHNPLNTAK